MKRYLYLVIALLVIAINACLQACDNFEELAQRREQKQKEKQLNPSSTAGKIYTENMQNVEFDGHLYVIYTEKDGYGYGAAMVHSPNYKCFKKN
jgi:hypothetical protein